MSRFSLTGPWARSVGIPLALALVCLRSLFQDGYLLQVDAVFGPRAAPIGSGFGAPVGLLQAAGVELLGGAWTGRLWAVGSLFLAGFAPMVLLRRALVRPGGRRVLAVLNPWVYDRFVEGQWGVLNAASGLFLWIAAWEGLKERPGPSPAALLALCTAAVAAFDPHALGPPRRPRARRCALDPDLATSASARVVRRIPRLPRSVAGVSSDLVLRRRRARWLRDRPAVHAGRLRVLPLGHERRLRPDPEPDRPLRLLGGATRSFPACRRGRRVVAADSTVVVAAALVGAWLRRAWLLAGVVGLAVSASTALPGGVDAAADLTRRLPLIAAYREPQKWSALWLVAVVVLAACASDALARRGRGEWAGPAVAWGVVVCALFPAGVAEIRSVATIVEPVEYPPYWFHTADYLARAVPDDEPILVLPWHLYQPLAVSEGRLVANPARVFFPGRLIVPQNLEIPGRFSEVSTRYDRIGAVIRRSGYRSCEVARAIRSENVNWVLVFDGVEGRGAVVGLRRCGFTLVQGRPGRTVVLRS